MALDLFRLLLIELGEFRTRGVVDAQKFIQFGMQRQIVARRLALWMNSVIANTASVAIAFHSNVAGLNASQNTA
jgi:hypothetical protein